MESNIKSVVTILPELSGLTFRHVPTMLSLSGADGDVCGGAEGVGGGVCAGGAPGEAAFGNAP